MRFDIVTIFPDAFESYFQASILKRAQASQLIEIKVHNLRDWATDKHHTTDDTPYGGGAGMVMKVEPFAEAVESLKQETNNQQPETRAGEKTRVILFSAKGKRLNQETVRRLAEYDRLILLCGRYEGVDERVAEHIADEEISLGEFVLTGGELPAMVVVDCVSRLVPGVLGNSESALDESFSRPNWLEYPQYTKPEEYRGWRVPSVLLSGHHAEIEKWRSEMAQKTNTLDETSNRATR